MILNNVEKQELTRYAEAYDFSSCIKNCSVLVTGSSGMIGTGIIKWLLYINLTCNANVHIFASTRRPEQSFPYVDSSDNIDIISYGNELTELADCHIDYIIHAASPTDKLYYVQHPIETLDVIVNGTKRILDIAHIKHSEFVYLSSVEVYGCVNSEKPIPEEYVGNIDPSNIRNCYPIGKKTAELLTLSYVEEYGVKAKIVRLSSVQGLFQSLRDMKVYNEILNCILSTSNFQLHSLGTTRKSFIYTLDAISAIFIVLTKGKEGGIYNVTNPSLLYTVRELASQLFRHYNTSCIVLDSVSKQNEIQYLHNLSFVQDVTKVKELGWECLSDLYHIYDVDIERNKKYSYDIRKNTKPG